MFVSLQMSYLLLIHVVCKIEKLISTDERSLYKTKNYTTIYRQLNKSEHNKFYIASWYKMYQC